MGWLLSCATAPPAPPPEPPALNPDLVQRGAFLFLDARLSADGSRSCSTCHPGGGSSGEFFARGVAVEPAAGGARRVPELRGLWQSAPYLWDGSIPTVRGAIARMLQVEMGGTGLSDIDERALESYLMSIPPFDNGRIEPDGTPVEPVTLSAQRGAGVFQRARCGECHRPPSYTHTSLFDVGTDGSWSVPTLRNVSRQSRLAHDGRWHNLEAAVAASLSKANVELTPRETRQLLSYLQLF